MKTKSIFVLMIMGLAIAFVSGSSVAAPNSPEEMAKIRNERMQLENAKKKEFEQCTRMKVQNLESYNKCMNMTKARYEAETHLLMMDPDTYFAKKQKREQKNQKNK